MEGIGSTTTDYGSVEQHKVKPADMPMTEVPRTLGRQLSPSNIRGQQNIVGSITVQDPASTNNVISLDGASNYILITDPTTQLNRIIIGKLPDGTYGMAISKSGKDVITDGFS